MKNFLFLVFHLFTIVLLTLTTQIGGILYIFTLAIHNLLIPKRFNGQVVVVFLGLYLFATFGIVPLLAPLFGREKVGHQQGIRPANYGYVLLNRNYVRPALNEVLQQTASRLTQQNTAIQIRYLDANFPFWNGFPLLPHLSHNDGKKIDLAFVYQNQQGELTSQQKSISGYGIFELPKRGESNQPSKCKQAGHRQYGLAAYLTLGQINPDLVFSETGTKTIIQALLQDKRLGKLFIEPHLKQRLRLQDSRVRYHGCHAVRHDDHIHVQL